MLINKLNMLHLIAPFSSLLIALLLLNKMQASSCTGGYDSFCEYWPAIYIFFSLVSLAIASLIPLFVKDAKGSFLVFFIAYPFWFFTAIAPLFTATAIAGALLSFLIILIATILQAIIGAAFHNTPEK